MGNLIGNLAIDTPDASEKLDALVDNLLNFKDYEEYANLIEGTSNGIIKGWNEFEKTTKGMFSNSTEAGKAWEVYKVEHGITTGTSRSSWQKAKFLKQSAERGKAPKWMNQWLKKGKVPSGYQVDHKKTLSVDGEDVPNSMR